MYKDFKKEDTNSPIKCKFCLTRIKKNQTEEMMSSIKELVTFPNMSGSHAISEKKKKQEQNSLKKQPSIRSESQKANTYS